MLPIVDKPLIQYGVEEAVSAGASSVIFITSRKKHSISDHFDTAFELETRLRADGKELDPAIQEAVAELWEGINTETLRQLSDFAGYKREFLQLFGFEVDGVDYEADVNPQVVIDNMA